jgi:hypothetical protein
MSDLAPVAAQPLAYRRPTKFTPTNIRQIHNLLERGKSKDEIAEIIDVTPATLQVTCSKLGISLRRPDPGDASVLPRVQPPPMARAAAHDQNRDLPVVQEPGPAREEGSKEPMNAAGRITPSTKGRAMAPKRPRPSEPVDSIRITLTMRQRGEERAIDLPVDRNVLGLLALEAEFRSMSIGVLIGRLLVSVTNSELLEFALEGSRDRSS